ncbi:MAG: hypothetical protein Q4G40_04800, partial [Brachybacterium sp.]|nr:hypothetical protein [Brachybacterium sp.]
EPLPLSVRAQELTVGRAHLLRRARARDAAAQSLRSAAATRIARTLGVRREESLEALIAAIGAHLAGRSPATTPGSDANADTRPAEHARRLLGPTPLGSEDELVRLAHDLDHLEKEIDR